MVNSRSKYRVLHISAARYVLDDQSHATYLIWRKLREGFEEYHIMARATGRPGLVTDGPLVIHLCRSVFARELEFLFSQFLFLPKAIRIKPHIIVAQSPVLGGLVALLIARILNIPILVELHGEEFIRRRATSIKARFIQFVSARVYRRVDKIRVLSNSMRHDLLATHTDLPTERVFVLAPRVDVALFPQKTSWQSQGSAITIVMVGSFTNRKGQLRAIKALSQCELPLRLCLIGDGPDMARCKEAAKQADGKLEVIFPGGLPPNIVAKYLQEADMFLMNSLSEGTPRAIMEAMSVGLPVITTDAGYCRDLVQHETTGIVLSGVECDDELRWWVTRLSKDPTLRERLGRAARARAEAHFESEINFRQYREMIASLAEAKFGA